MPMIELTAPAGSLTDAGRKSVQRDLATLLLKWEGAPDNDFFRSVAWTYLHELPAGAQTTALDDAPRFRVDVTVPVGALSDRRKEGLIKEATELVLEAAGLDAGDAIRVWVLIHEQPEGTWGAGGQVVKVEELRKLAEKG
ncbi:4-oxalocrotonate tautomerase [Lentzea aerocolonigenes]|uniref:4-oxalocrotonate tautomerase n=1 Tax=Lentzea aerocolonigenes TaxID=68170 RepID=A0A0F0GVI5_LENAE|nr:tautomerase family protein [Lentzea aerocolonigenes]KJK47459.1 4-oxalocrotonate tautomerase [Lentzea aerocolonigenes]